MTLVPILMPLLTANLSAQLAPQGLTGPAMRQLMDQVGRENYFSAPAASGKVAAQQNDAEATPQKTVFLKVSGVDATKKHVSAEQALADLGITLSNVAENTRVVIVDARTEYEGKAVLPPSYDNPNIMTQKGANGPISFTMNFKRPICELSLTRPALIAGEHGISHPYWAAIAFSGGAVAAEIEEEMIKYFNRDNPLPAKTFTLTAKDPKKGFDSVRVNSDGDIYFRNAEGKITSQHFAAFGGVLISNLTITYCQ
ncbi:MAG: hypothetical protein HY921_12345 [Elusimicrobia bacterium]|nr:hypothetical protein [Elusimicrobiota bacterium]